MLSPSSLLCQMSHQCSPVSHSHPFHATTLPVSAPILHFSGDFWPNHSSSVASICFYLFMIFRSTSFARDFFSPSLSLRIKFQFLAMVAVRLRLGSIKRHRCIIIVRKRPIFSTFGWIQNYWCRWSLIVGSTMWKCPTTMWHAPQAIRPAWRCAFRVSVVQKLLNGWIQATPNRWPVLISKM